MYEPGTPYPALLTSASTVQAARGDLRRTAARPRRASRGRRRRPRRGRRDFVRSRSATACSRSSRRAAMARSKPSAANTSAKASPIPEDAPVINAVRFIDPIVGREDTAGVHWGPISPRCAKCRGRVRQQVSRSTGCSARRQRLDKHVGASEIPGGHALLRCGHLPSLRVVALTRGDRDSRLRKTPATAPGPVSAHQASLGASDL